MYAHEPLAEYHLGVGRSGRGRERERGGGGEVSWQVPRL